MKKKKLLNFLLPIITIAIILVFWTISAIKIDNKFILPDISETLTAFFSLFRHAEFYSAFFGTLLRSIIAFVCSFTIALILAFVSDRYPLSKRVIAPIVSLLRAMPTIAVVLLLLLWTNSQVAPVIVTALVVFPTCYTNVITAINSVGKDQIEASEIDGATNKNIVFNIQFLQILPELLVVIGSGLSLNLKLMVAAEVLSQTANSMGLLLNVSKVYFEVATMFALVLVSVVTGIIIETVCTFVSKSLK